MKLTLDVEIPIEVQEGGELKESLRVFFRDYTKKEKKELDALRDKLKALYKKANKLLVQVEITEQKIHLYDKMGESEKALEFVKQKERFIKSAENIQDEILALGGEKFEEKLAKKRFDLLVSGEDKEKLRKYAEIKGYGAILNVLDMQKEKIEKKQYGALPPT